MIGRIRDLSGQCPVKSPPLRVALALAGAAYAASLGPHPQGKRRKNSQFQRPTSTSEYQPSIRTPTPAPAIDAKFEPTLARVVALARTYTARVREIDDLVGLKAGTAASADEAGLATMPDGQNDNHAAIVAVKRHIAVASKIDQQFPFIEIASRTPHFRVGGKGLNGSDDRRRRSFGGGGIFGLQERPEPLQVAESGRCKDHLWHSGAAFSSSVPHVSSQAATSSPVT